MKPLSVTLVLFGVLALLQPARQLDLPGALLGVVVLLCAATTFRSTVISSFLKIFVGIFSTETIVFGLAVLAGRAGLWPADYAEYLPPESLPLTVAIFSILVYLVAQSRIVRQIMRIADRYFNAEEAGRVPEVMRHQGVYYEEEARRRMTTLSRAASWGLYVGISCFIIFLIIRMYSSIYGGFGREGLYDSLMK